MNKLVALVAMLFCLGLWGQGARAGSLSLSLDFGLTAIGVDIPGNQTTVTSVLTATISAPSDAMFTATFTNSDGFVSPLGIGPFNPTISPGVCSPTFTCTIMGLDFTRPGTAAGTATFTATGVLQDGFQPIQQVASFQATVPEPGALALLSLGLVALGIALRRSAGAKPR